MNLANLTTEELRELNIRIVNLLKTRTLQEARKFELDQKVKFLNKFNQEVVGKIIKINPQTIVVKAYMFKYKCSPSLLTVITDEEWEAGLNKEELKAEERFSLMRSQNSIKECHTSELTNSDPFAKAGSWPIIK